MKKQTKAVTGTGVANARSGTNDTPTQLSTGTKQAKVIELLQREHGASIAEMQEATGWLPHTTRAALTGIRKRGTTIEKSKVDRVTRYKVAAQ